MRKPSENFSRFNINRINGIVRKVALQSKISPYASNTNMQIHAKKNSTFKPQTSIVFKIRKKLVVLSG